MLGQTVYYYKAVEYDESLPSNNKSNRGEIKLLFATDIVLLGSGEGKYYLDKNSTSHPANHLPYVTRLIIEFKE